MSEPEEFTFVQKIKCADCDGVPIKVGSVLQEINDRDKGVVIRINRKVDGDMPGFSQVGDVLIELSRGITRVTNRYNQWKHIPHNEQTYSQRLLSWQMRGYIYDEDPDSLRSKDEGLAIDGIMSLLPDNIVDWEYGMIPDSINNALTFLTNHLESLTNKSHE